MADFTKLNGYTVKDPQAVHTYDTVADLKADTKLKAGNHVQTKGYTAVNDGGKASYVIVDDNTLVQDDGTVHDIVNGLKAVLLIGESVTPEMFGAIGDGVHDDTIALQKAFDQDASIKCKAKQIYLCSNTINLNKRKCIDFSLSTIKFTNNGVGLNINMENSSTYSHLRFAPIIENMILDGEDTTKVMYIDYAYKSVFKNIYINNFKNVGMEKNRGYELVIDNIFFWASNQNTTSIGLLVTGNDCEFGNIFGINCHTGVKMIGGGNHFKNIHMWLFNDTQDNGMLDGDALYQGSAMIEIAGNDRYFIDYAYFDSYQYGFKYSGYGFVKLNSGFMYCPELSALTENYTTTPIYFIYAESPQIDYLYRFCINNLVYALSTGNTVTAKMIPDGYSKKPIRVINSTIPYDINNLRTNYINQFTFEYCTNVNVSATPIGDDKLLIKGILKKDSDNSHGWRITPNDSAYTPITVNEVISGIKDTSQYFTGTPTPYAYNLANANASELGYTTPDDYYRVEYILKINYSN